MLTMSEHDGPFSLAPRIMGVIGCGTLLSSLLWVATGGTHTAMMQRGDNDAEWGRSVVIVPAQVSAMAGSAARFSVNSDETLTYTWQVSTDDGATYRDVATGAEFVIPAVEPWMDQSLFRVEASMTSDPSISNVAILRVTAAQ